MNSNTRSPEEIERQIEAERSDLTNTLENLQEKFSLDSVVRQISGQFRENGGDIGRSVAQSVKDNPIALALTGVGLAWLMMGNNSTRSSGNHGSRRDYAPTPSAIEPVWARRQIGVDSTDGLRDNQIGYPTGHRSLESETERSGVGDHNSSRELEGYEDESKQMESLASGRQSDPSFVDKAKSRMSDARDSVSQSAASARDSVANTASGVRDWVSDGTETLSEEARARVIGARRSALAARDRGQQTAQAGADKAVDFFEQQPLVVGALAIAAGAALGGALPRTRAEDNLAGAASDDLMAEAERIFHEEKSKVGKVVDAMVDEGKRTAQDVKRDLDDSAPGNRSAVETIADKAKEAGNRVVDAAKEESDNQNMGKPRT